MGDRAEPLGDSGLNRNLLFGGVILYFVPHDVRDCSVGFVQMISEGRFRPPNVVFTQEFTWDCDIAHPSKFVSHFQQLLLFAPPCFARGLGSPDESSFSREIDPVDGSHAYFVLVGKGVLWERVVGQMVYFLEGPLFAHFGRDGSNLSNVSQSRGDSFSVEVASN